jgi:HEAT repeat protein
VLAVEFPHGEFLVFGIFFAIVGTALITISRFLPESPKPIVTAVAPVETMPLGPAGAVWEPAAEVAEEPVVVARAITWPRLVDPAAGVLDDNERRRVIDGLGIVGDAWCADILAQAVDEEDGELRVAALESLGHCVADNVGPTLERAYSSNVVAERYAAVDGASRRGDVPLLERALRDGDATVALAAAYGLHRANRNDIVITNLAARNDDTARQIRSTLAILV